MNWLQGLGLLCVHLSLGLTVLVALVASEFSGAVTIVALCVSLVPHILSALCGTSLNQNESTYRKRRLCDILEFFQIWFEMLELLAASATCARVTSATVDYISDEKFREWFLGIESHSLGEPWPDILGVSVVIVVVGLFMLGLDNSPVLTVLLLIATMTTYVFFIWVGFFEMVLTLKQWKDDFKKITVQSVLTAAAMCSYGFVNTFPKLGKFKTLKIVATILTFLLLYGSLTMVFTLMSHHRELAGTATPLLRIFEIRDVDWARLIMSICVVCVVSLALTEIFPSLYAIFETLASKEWRIFFGSLQYRNTFTGAPLLAIFAAGSLSAILAFACPLAHLVKLLNMATLLKCIFKSLLVLYFYYRPEYQNNSYLVSSTSTHYSKLKSRKGNAPNFKNKLSEFVSGFRSNVKTTNIKTKTNKVTSDELADDEYLLLNEYNEKPVDAILNDDSSDDNEEKESILSSDVESYSSTDIDAVVQEYKDKIQVATIDTFDENKRPTYVTATTVVIFLIITIISTICLSQLVIWKLYSLQWSCFTISFFSTTVILVMPTNSYQNENAILPKSLTPLFNIICMQFHIILVASLMDEIWLGIVFWFIVGCLLLWRCECCTCDGLLADNQKGRLNITENIVECPDNYVDTILIAR